MKGVRLTQRALAVVLTTLTFMSASTAPVTAASPAMGDLHVLGNQIVDGAGQPARLRGVNRSGSEYSCVRRTGIFDGPASAASIQAMLAWHINTVRIPLNEDCWLGINGVPTAYGVGFLSHFAA